MNQKILQFATGDDLIALQEQLRVVLGEGLALVRLSFQKTSEGLLFTGLFEESSSPHKWAVIVQPDATSLTIADREVRRIECRPHQDGTKPEVLVYAYLERGLGDHTNTPRGLSTREALSSSSRLEFSFD